MQAKIKLNKKPHCVPTHHPCRGCRLRAKIRKWRVALLQVVTRGLSISSPGSRSPLTLESASGKATLDIMKLSVTGPLSSLLSLSLPYRIFWLNPFCKLMYLSDQARATWNMIREEKHLIALCLWFGPQRFQHAFLLKLQTKWWKVL